MWEIIGLLLLVLAAVMGLAFLGDWLADFDGFYSKGSPPKEHKKQRRDYEGEKAKAVYNATGKSLKLNMMQMDAFRRMSDAAKRNFNQHNDDLR